MSYVLRPAEKRDIAPLLALERACFDYDRLSARSLRRFLDKAHADLAVAESAGELIGYILLLYRRGTSLARIYSLAVSPARRGQGVAKALLEHAATLAKAQECLFVRLEVRPDNAAAIALYQRLGYRQFGRKPNYYQDHSAALQFEKRIVQGHPVTGMAVPFYQQTTDFTCGPSALMMAMAALDNNTELSQSQELKLWRESTTIFMTSGHGGCGPHGLALAASLRGYQVELYLSHQDILFIDSVRHPDKRAVISQVQQDFTRQLSDTDVLLHKRAFTQADLERHLDQGQLLLLLISTYRLNRNKAPHWVVLTAQDTNFFYLHDPDVEDDGIATAMDNQYMPVDKQQLLAMARFGRSQLRTAVVLGRK